MKKLLSLVLALTLAAFATLSLTACAKQMEDSDTSSKKPGTTGVTTKEPSETYKVVADYDYGYHRPGLATILYSYSTLFFTLPEGFDPTVAGDEFTITYTGELLIQESYPSSVVITGGEIVSVSAEPAVICTVRYNVKNRRLTVFDENGEVMQIDYLNYPQYYIIDGEGHYAELRTLTEDTILYGSVSPTDQEHAAIQISFTGLYLQNPRGE